MSDDLAQHVLLAPLLGELRRATGGEADVVWLRGRVNWHDVRAFAAQHRDRLRDAVLVVEGPEREALPPQTGDAAYAAYEAQREIVKHGLHAAARAIDRDATVLWLGADCGTAVVLPPATAARLEPWIATTAPVLSALNEAHDTEARLRRENRALVELADSVTRDAGRIVRSKRFRIGTRAVHLGRTAMRRDPKEIFRSPRRILARPQLIEAWRARVAAERISVAPRAPGKRLRVTYLLPEVRLTGGAIVVTELANELHRLGVDARIATVRIRRSAQRMPLLERPLVFADPGRLARELPATDIVVATHWSTATWARDAIAARKAQHAAYFIQDYEAWFYDTTDVETRDRVHASYGLIDHRIATSQWLAGLLDADGHRVEHVIAPGAELDVFFPRAGASARPCVFAMARPRTPRRGFDTVVAALRRVHDARPDVEIVLFGERLGAMQLPFPYRNVGVVSDRDWLARLYSRATVHFDGSDFQAFGRAGLEAMACGTPSVLTNVGGVHEYAVDGKNAVLVPPQDPVAAADAIIALLQDDDRRAALAASGLDTVQQLSMRRQARATLDAFTALTSTAGG